MSSSDYKCALHFCSLILCVLCSLKVPSSSSRTMADTAINTFNDATTTTTTWTSVNSTEPVQMDISKLGIELRKVGRGGACMAPELWSIPMFPLERFHSVQQVHSYLDSIRQPYLRSLVFDKNKKCLMWVNSERVAEGRRDWVLLFARYLRQLDVSAENV